MSAMVSPEGALYKVLNPVAEIKEMQLQGVSPRLVGLEGKTIYVVNSTKPVAESIQPHIANLLKERHPDAEVRLFSRKGYRGEEPELFEELTKGKADAVIYGVAD